MISPMQGQREKKKKSGYWFRSFCSPIKCFSCSQASSFCTNWILCAVCLSSSSKILWSISYCCRKTENPASHYLGYEVLVINIFAQVPELHAHQHNPLFQELFRSPENHIFPTCFLNDTNHKLWFLSPSKLYIHRTTLIQRVGHLWPQYIG